jgi:predicted RNA-binding Zn-ribbon protein involved in translation (DUF1610 family)
MRYASSAYADSDALKQQTMKYICPVCGFPDLYDPPRSEFGGGSYEICPSCGFQFGVSDENDGLSYEEWREAWIEQGMSWQSKGIAQPAGWNPTEQIRQIQIHSGNNSEA